MQFCPVFLVPIFNFPLLVTGVVSLKLELVGWKGAQSLRAYVPKNERIHYLRLVGTDTSKYEINKFEARRENQENAQKAKEAETESAEEKKCDQDLC